MKLCTFWTEAWKEAHCWDRADTRHSLQLRQPRSRCLRLFRHSIHNGVVCLVKILSTVFLRYCSLSCRILYQSIRSASLKTFTNHDSAQVIFTRMKRNIYYFIAFGFLYMHFRQQVLTYNEVTILSCIYRGLEIKNLINSINFLLSHPNRTLEFIDDGVICNGTTWMSHSFILIPPFSLSVN